MKRLATIAAVFWLGLTPMVMAEPDPVEFTMVSVQASNRGTAQKTFDRGLETVKPAIASLSYDTFQKLGAAEAVIPFGKSSTFYINEKYSLVVEPTAVDDQGRVRLKTQIMMKSQEEGKSIKALDTVLVMAPGKHLNLGGLKLPEGDLIVVLKVR